MGRAPKEAKDTSSEGKSKLQETLDRLNKQYGQGSVMTLGQKQVGDYQIISTGSIAMDYVTLGVGGVVLGKMYEVRGWEGVGKSTLCANLAADCQRKEFKGRKGKVAYIDGEHAVNRQYFERLGVDVDDMVFSQPSTGEEGFDIAENLIKSGEIDLLIIDSDSSLIPKSMIDNPIQDVTKVGKKASLNSTAYPRLKTACSDYDVAIIITSQYREKMGVMYGDPKITQGGHALKFYSDVIIEMSKSLIKNSDGSEVYGNETKVKTIKNKMHPPHISCSFEIIFNEGINRTKEIIQIGSELGIISKGGAGWFTIGETKLQGENNVKQFFLDNPEYAKSIEEEVLQKLKEKSV